MCVVDIDFPAIIQPKLDFLGFNPAIEVHCYAEEHLHIHPLTNIEYTKVSISFSVLSSAFVDNNIETVRDLQQFLMLTHEIDSADIEHRLTCTLCTVHIFVKREDLCTVCSE